jgi:hypothetical protein
MDACHRRRHRRWRWRSPASLPAWSVGSKTSHGNAFPGIAPRLQRLPCASGPSPHATPSWPSLSAGRSRNPTCVRPSGVWQRGPLQSAQRTFWVLTLKRETPTPCPERPLCQRIRMRLRRLWVRAASGALFATSAACVPHLVNHGPGHEAFHDPHAGRCHHASVSSQSPRSRVPARPPARAPFLGLHPGRHSVRAARIT